MKRRKWWGVMFIALAVLLVVTACSNNSNEEPSDTATPVPTQDVESSPATPDTPEPLVLEPATFTMNTSVATMNWDNPVAAVIKEKTGVTVEWDVMTGDVAQRMSIWLAAGDYPDLISLQPTMLDSYIDGNALVELTDLIHEHGPNILAAYNNDLSPLQQQDGKIWALRAPPTQEINNLTNRGWLNIQAAVLKEAGYPEIKTLDDIYQVVSSYVQKYPEIDGSKTLGFSNFGNDNQLFNIFNTAATMHAGYPPTGTLSIDDNNEGKLVFFDTHYTDVLTFFNKMNREGLFDPEALVQNPEQFNAKCAQGRVLVAFGPVWASGCTAALTSGGMPERGYIAFEVLADSVTKYEPAVSTAALTGSDFWTGITNNAEDPVRIIQFFNQLYDLESQILLGWGVEGETYEVVNGVRTPTDYLWDELQKGGDAWERLGMSYSRPFMGMMQAGAYLWDGDFARWNNSENWVQRGLTSEIKEALSEYGANTFVDLMAPAEVRDYKFTTAFYTEEMNNFNREAIAQWGIAMSSYVLESDPSKLDGIWSDLEKTLKDRGMDKFLEDFNKLYKEHLDAQ